MNDVRTVVEDDMALLPVQHPSAPAGPAQARARFFNSGNAFNLTLPDVPATVFVAEAAAALAAQRSEFIVCDQSVALGLSFPATTPLMLARYAVVAAHDTLTANFVATGAIWYVVAGSGQVSVGEETFACDRGDVFVTPGGIAVGIAAAAASVVLWLVTNEPQLAFDGLHPATGVARTVDVVHYPAAEIERQLARVVSAGQNDATAGIALIFSAERQEAGRNIMPSLTLSLNTVPAGERQRTHQHNSAAITLILSGHACYSLVGDERCDWAAYATLVTPATVPHSHHNESTERAMFLIVQDGGLHYHARTMGFTFLEPDGR